MKILNKTVFQLGRNLAMASLLVLSGSSIAASISPVIDDFSDQADNNLGIPRQFMNDTVAGGKTNTELDISGGVMHLKGEIVPPRGQPGWASSIFLLDPTGLPQDVSKFEGIRLLVKINSGSISVSANSTEITNFDYHSALVEVKSDGEFHEVKIPFASMKRTWSEQTKLNTKTLNGLSLVAFSLRKAMFDFEVDEVSFY